MGLVGHIELGDGVRGGAQSGVTHSIAAGQTVSGSPARPQREWLQYVSLLPKLPEIYRKLKQLEQQVSELTAQLNEEPKP